jgi:RNA polymerase primary sigma factor
MELDERDRFVLLRRLGLYDGKIWELRAIGDELGVTRERARQIENRARRRLNQTTEDKIPHIGTREAV